MRALPLFASFVVVLTAARADLKDPAQVASDWNTNIVDAQKPMVGSLGLREQVAGDRYPGLKRSFESGPQLPPPVRAPRLHDAPAPNPHRDPLDIMPRGSKRWPFNGTDYWIVPLGG